MCENSTALFSAADFYKSSKVLILVTLSSSATLFPFSKKSDFNQVSTVDLLQLLKKPRSANFYQQTVENCQDWSFLTSFLQENHKYKWMSFSERLILEG